MTTALAKINRARKELEEAKTIDDVVDIRDKATALLKYFKAIRESLVTQNAAAEIKLRAERKAGVMLAELDLHGGDRKSKLQAATLMLEDLGIEKTQSHRWQKEASVDDEQFDQHVNHCNENEIELTQASVLKLAGAGHVSQSSAENEWYTPETYIEAARRAMGGIDLDPASSDDAQRVVNAGEYYTIADDGLFQDWSGRVWLNPPYSKELIGRFAGKLVEHVESKDVTQAIVLVNNATETAWFQLLAGYCAAICFHSGRIQFCGRNGKPANSPLQGQAFIYFGRRIAKFCSEFSEFGFVMWASRSGNADRPAR
jgi:phage N-6-adenine-methyltransferase